MSNLSRILIVDDQALLLLSLADGLADCGIDTVAVTSARAAMDFLDADIDGLVTDIEMPGPYDGLQLASVAARIRPSLPIIVVSGGVCPQKAQLPQGAIFIPKPYRIEDIVTGLTRQIKARAA